jgi:bile salt-stimulated lipase
MLARQFVILVLMCVCHGHDERPVVITSLGKIRGYLKTSHDGRKFSAFEGVPFAKPPIGSRRFEEPEPPEPWSGVLEANNPTECAQTGMMQPNVVQGDEDCLHINVYVPRENVNPQEKLDVVVHIHGGAYMYGNGTMYSRPEFLMDRDVIFVTFNYRLGILGFLSTEDDVVPGNNGLKDQVMALRWVQNHIASFGGNPGSVTLTGLSAGGSSVHFHYFSEMSKGLFHRGLSQSGVALNSFSLQEDALTKAQRLADAVGCPSIPTQALVDCLKQRHHTQILEKVPLFFGYSFLPFAPFAPVVEKGSKPFLSEHPYSLLTKGKINDVPWISSNTAHEGIFPTMLFENDLDNIATNWESLAPVLLDFNDTLAPSLWKDAAQKIREFYLGQDQNGFDQNKDKLLKMFSDRIFLVDAEISVRMQARASSSPVYYYYFSYPGDNNEAKLVSHGADAKYFFGSVFVPGPLTSDELKMKDIVVDMLVSYAKTSVPLIEGVKWDPTASDKLTYLDIASFKPAEMKVETVDELTPIGFWKSLRFAENENLVSVKDEL